MCACILLEVFYGVVEVWMATRLEVFFVCVEGERFVNPRDLKLIQRSSLKSSREQGLKQWQV